MTACLHCCFFFCCAPLRRVWLYHLYNSFKGLSLTAQGGSVFGQFSGHAIIASPA